MTGHNDVELYRGNETLPATIRWWNDGDEHTVELSSALGTHTATEWNAFSALEQLREQLEPDGWLIGVNGARRDVSVSGMALDMGGGLSVYVHDTDPPRLVDTFGRAERRDVATRVEQQAWIARHRARPQRPPITDEMRRHAAGNPGTWLYVIAAGFDPMGEVPPEAIKGAYWVDESGEITDGYRQNERYRPTPAEQGMPEPQSRAEDVAQKVATGWATKEDLMTVLMGSEVYIGPTQPGGVEVYTSLGHVPGYVEAAEPTSFSTFVTDWDASIDVILNPVSPGTVRIEGRLLAP